MSRGRAFGTVLSPAAEGDRVESRDVSAAPGDTTSAVADRGNPAVAGDGETLQEVGR